MKFHKLTAGLLALSIVGTFVPASAPILTVCAAEEPPTSGTCGENVTWRFDESTGTLTISGEGEMNDNNPWYAINEQITAIVIENGVTSIADHAFQYSAFLTSVTIPDSVTSIKPFAFETCASLSSVTIPDGVTTIGEWAFSGCTSLTSIVIPDSVTNIESYAFSDCTSLTTVTIPDSVTSIGRGTFENCASLTEVTILNPDCKLPEHGGIITNSTDANGSPIFTGAISGYDNSTAQAYAEKYGCTFRSLGAAPASEDGELSGTCGENVTWRFDESTGTLTISGTGDMEKRSWTESVSPTEIKAVVIEKGVTNIVDHAFQYSAFLTSVTIPDSVTSIGSSAFDGCGLTAVTVPESVTSIGEHAFYNCKYLTSFTIPDGVTEIANEAFYGCEGLTEVTIPDGVTSIGNYAFRYCESLTSVTIPDSVTSIGYLAFELCTSLTEITIPDSVTSIGKAAFRMCEGLTTVTIPDSVTSIDEYAFQSTPWLTERQQANPQVVVNGILIDAANCEGDVVIEDGVTSICNYAFEDCTALTTATIPVDVTGIGKGAFSGCKSLTDIIILNPDCAIAEYAAPYKYIGTISGYEGSTAQTYAEEEGFIFKSLGAAPERPAADVPLGDVSGDGKIDSSDAADLLIALAMMGAGEDAGLTDAQKAAADTDGNGELNAADATVILQYAAYLGAGGTGTLQEFLASQTA